MDKKELDKEATEYALKWGDKTDGTYACCRDGYLAGAEPREKRIAELEKELEQAKKVQVVEHFEAYGQCRDSRRIASLETENAELKDKLKNLESVAKVRLANWQKYEKENAELKTQAKKIILKLYNAGRDVLMCRADEAAYDNLSTAINDRSIEQFLKENNNEQART